MDHERRRHIQLPDVHNDAGVRNSSMRTIDRKLHATNAIGAEFPRGTVVDCLAVDGDDDAWSNRCIPTCIALRRWIRVPMLPPRPPPLRPWDGRPTDFEQGRDPSSIKSNRTAVFHDRCRAVFVVRARLEHRACEIDATTEIQGFTRPSSQHKERERERESIRGSTAVS